MWTVFSYSEAGGHPINEDCFCTESNQDRLLVTLADGQGGQAGGGKAAQLASESVLRQARLSPFAALGSPGSWTTFLRRADEEVSRDKESGLTTLIGLCVTDDAVHGASNGDSAVLLFLPKGRIEELTGRQAKNPPVGSGAATCIPFSAKLELPWTILVMSDGVWKYVGNDRIREIARREQGQAMVDSILAAAKSLRSGKLQDDFTLIVIQDAVQSMFDLREIERRLKSGKGTGRPLREILQEFDEAERIAESENYARPLEEILHEVQGRKRQGQPVEEDSNEPDCRQ
jgi:PPM family protein phosphatase